MCELVAIFTAGSEADSDDCGIWCYLGWRTLTDSCKLSYSGTYIHRCVWKLTLYSSQKQLRGNIPDDNLWDCSAYIVGEVFRALRQSFANARGIQVSPLVSVNHSHLECVCMCTGLVFSLCQEGVSGPQAHGVGDSTGITSSTTIPQALSQECMLPSHAYIYTFNY